MSAAATLERPAARRSERTFALLPHPTTPIEERFLAKVQEDEAGCWLWTANLSVDGYGRFVVTHNRPANAHRWAYEQWVGPIPDGFQLDHLCRIRRCVNYEHCEPVTSRENVRRSESPMGINARKTECSQGHEFSSENTRIDTRGRRECRICRRANQKTYKAKRRLRESEASNE